MTSASAFESRTALSRLRNPKREEAGRFRRGGKAIRPGAPTVPRGGKARSSLQTGSPLSLPGNCPEEARGVGDADSCRPAPPESAPI